MNQIKKLFGQTIVYGMGIVLPRLLNYVILTPFYTRIFKPEEYGIITELYAYVVFLIVILTYGLETGFFRFVSKDQRNVGGIYKTVLASIFLSTVFFLSVENVFNASIAASIGYADFAYLIRWLAIIVSIDAFSSIPFAFIRIKSQPGKYSIIKIIEVVVNIGLNIFFLLYCPSNTHKEFVDLVYNPELGVGYVLLVNLISSIVKLLLLTKEIFYAFRFSFEFTLLKGILKYSYPLLIAGLAGTINEALDRILIKHLISESDSPMYQLGIYGANFKIAVLMTLYVQMFRYAAEPFFFSKANDINAKEMYGDIMKFFLIPAFLIFLIVTLFIDYFALFIGIDFREGIAIVPVVLLANLVMGVFFNLSIWYKLSDKTIYGAFLVIIGAIITIVINVIFLPHFGYIASAWAHLISYSVMVIVSYWLSLKHYRIAYDIKRIFFYVLLVLSVYLIDNFYVQVYLNNFVLVKVLLIVLTGIIFYFFERKTFKKYN